MDIMRISSNLMKGMIAKLLKKAFKNKLGYEIDIILDEFEAAITDDGKAHVHLNIDAEMSKEELMKLIKNIGL